MATVYYNANERREWRHVYWQTVSCVYQLLPLFYYGSMTVASLLVCGHVRDRGKNAYRGRSNDCTFRCYYFEDWVVPSHFLVFGQHRSFPPFSAGKAEFLALAIPK